MPDLIFPVSEVAEVMLDFQRKTAVIKARFGGLFGQDSPLPSFWLTVVLRSCQAGDQSWSDFLNILTQPVYQIRYNIYKNFFRNRFNGVEFQDHSGKIGIFCWLKKNYPHLSFYFERGSFWEFIEKGPLSEKNKTQLFLGNRILKSNCFVLKIDRVSVKISNLIKLRKEINQIASSFLGLKISIKSFLMEL